MGHGAGCGRGGRGQSVLHRLLPRIRHLPRPRLGRNGRRRQSCRGGLGWGSLRRGRWRRRSGQRSHGYWRRWGRERGSCLGRRGRRGSGRRRRGRRRGRRRSRRGRNSLLRRGRRRRRRRRWRRLRLALLPCLLSLSRLSGSRSCSGLGLSSRRRSRRRARSRLSRLRLERCSSRSLRSRLLRRRRRGCCRLSLGAPRAALLLFLRLRWRACLLLDLLRHRRRRSHGRRGEQRRPSLRVDAPHGGEGRPLTPWGGAAASPG